jgi:hypothetical protein
MLACDSPTNSACAPETLVLSERNTRVASNVASVWQFIGWIDPDLRTVELNRRAFTLLLTAGMAALSASTARATVTPLGYWRLGEHDLGARPGDPCHEFSLDALGGSSLQRQGRLTLNNAFYTSAVSAAAAGKTGSTPPSHSDLSKRGMAAGIVGLALGALAYSRGQRDQSASD